MTTQRRHDDEPAPAPVRADRAAGVVLASAAGDALGAGDELGPPLVQETLVETLVAQGAAPEATVVEVEACFTRPRPFLVEAATDIHRRPRGDR